MHIWPVGMEDGTKIEPRICELVAFLKDNEYKIIKNKTYNLFLTATLVEWMGERFGLQRDPICSRYCITTM